MDWYYFFWGIVVYFMGVFFDKLRNWLFARRSRDGSYDRRTIKGTWIGALLKLFGLFLTINAIFQWMPTKI